MIRIGRRVYKGNKFTDPKIDGFIPVLVLTASSPYGSLGPYVLKDEKNRIFENFYQGCKVYDHVPKTVQLYSRWDNRIIWDHPYEKHVDEKGELLPAYWAWREKLMNAKDAIRYPVGNFHRKNCLYSLVEIETDVYMKLDYIEARKLIYLPEYVRLAKKGNQYRHLLDMLKKGVNILIIEVDAPHGEDLQYYKDKYGVGDDFIVNDTSLCTLDNIKLFLNDPKHPFGHGYCLGIGLLGDLENKDYIKILQG